MPKYLITGGAGFIGSHLVDRLSPSEAELVDQPLCGGQTVRRTHRTNLLSSLRDNICRLAPFHRLWAKAAARPGNSQVCRAYYEGPTYPNVWGW